MTLSFGEKLSLNPFDRHGQPKVLKFSIMEISQSADPVAEYFRERLRMERVRRSWSQAYVAKCLSDMGIGQMHISTIAKIEAGGRVVRLTEAAAIADLFDIPLANLLGRQNEGEAGAHAKRAARRLREVLSHAGERGGRFQRDVFGAESDLATVDDLAFEGQEDLRAEFAEVLDALTRARDAYRRIANFVVPPDFAGVAWQHVQHGDGLARIRPILGTLGRWTPPDNNKGAS
ncbi:helix-turn-helix transcriptional regulator [Mycobacterium antarcticum]|uniref:helix-turn-helix transcriptional regulator n=1 Tax=Mycolicibacterium sp. TUM20983 TaxID=3023369 RepID=UPI0024E14C17|nr:helix-turn-helix transcriptional regulator [Mycolicibacterium sp. TUM20983]